MEDRKDDDKKGDDKLYKSWYSNPVYRVGKKKDSYWSSSSWSKWTFDDELYGRYDDDWGSMYTGLGVPVITKDRNKKICEDALRTVGRSANVILNSSDSERKLSVKFSSGSNENTVSTDVIYISPDKLVSAADNKEKRNDVIDALCGQVMLSSQIKRQVTPEVYEKFKKQEDHDVCSLWSAIELAVARSAVISDWSGFKPYFDSYAISSTDASAKAIKKMLYSYDGSSEDKPTSASAFIKGLAWNLYMSHSPIKIPSAYDKGKALVAEGLAKVNSSEERWQFCDSVVRELRAMFDVEPPPPETGGSPGPGDDEYSYPDDPEKGMYVIEKAKVEKKPLTRKKGADKFSGIDRELFGLDPVSNKKCASADTIDAITGDKSSESTDIMSAPAVPHIDSKCDVQDRVVWLPPDKPNPGLRKSLWKPENIKLMNIYAEKLKDSFNFKSSDNVRKVYGYDDGAIHDGSLYKVPMGLNNIFYRKSRAESDKVAVCLLIDQSGSMGSSGDHDNGSRMNQAARVAYVLARMCKSVKDINLSIIGFSAQEGSSEAKKRGIRIDDEVTLRKIYDDEDPATSIDSILDMRHHANNTDGFAIWHTAKYMAGAKSDYKRKVVIVVSDGTPNANNYGGESAYTHVKMCKTDAKRRFGVETYAIGVDNAYTKKIGDKMYGEGENIIISDVKSSLGYISRFLNQVAESVS